LLLCLDVRAMADRGITISHQGVKQAMARTPV
jgi:hypothetical protein